MKKFKCQWNENNIKKINNNVAEKMKKTKLANKQIFFFHDCPYI